MTPLAYAIANSGPELVDQHCSGCHVAREGENSWSRISQQRKTPEGWEMTIARMGIMHGVEVPPADRRALVKYLADTRGLAPEESAAERALIERRLNRVEEFDHPTFQEMCARCHTGGRAMLQRRPEAEWDKLVHFHVGQFQTLEFQAMARDRDWFGLARSEIVPWLAEQLPLESEAWSNWQEVSPRQPEGTWQMWGNWPGQGRFVADVAVTPETGRDRYRLEVSGEFLDGRPLLGEGRAVVYTGYEWRASLTLNGHEFKQVLDMSEETAHGRIFDDADEAYGMQVTMQPADAVSGVAATLPTALKAGQSQRLVVMGSGLENGEITLGDGIEVEEVVERSDTRVTLQVNVADHVAPGWLPLTVGEHRQDELLVAYDEVDYLQIEPELAVARVGSPETPAVSGVFQAIGYLKSPDGGEDIALGDVPVTWSVQPWDEIAEHDGDVQYAGVMDKATGIFAPSGAGPNPDRKYDANNVGNLRVIADVEGQATAVQDDAHLIVTVQRWNNPPLR
ncbi:quinohemoprotein amine dehydrogenase subunit alpha [Billgrantia saliphila]|uniref:quinohemoprotein amine dehydrogenase subunit alpha n=1 Tax=Billgrantia saliphila TaxID=1848458 RepID=UPI0018CBF499|nr:quinohemoprotein amine dehydrogenase subunit alpha [Halomonas saliphila]